MPARSQRGRRGAVKRKIAEVEHVEEAPKQYSSPWEKDVDQILEFVKTAGERGFPFAGPESNLNMMKLCALPALCETREDRHKNQAVMVDLMDQGLNDIETRMHANLGEMKESLATADAVTANLETIRNGCADVLASKEEVLHLRRETHTEKKDFLASKRKETDSLKKELKERTKKEAVEQAVLDALVNAYDVEFKRLTVKPEPPAPVEPAAPVEGEAAPAVEGELEKQMEAVEIVEKPKEKRASTGRGRKRRESAPKEPTIEDHIEIILAQMRLHGADESLMNALPFALKVALETPKGFDLETLNACTKFFGEKRSWTEGNLFLIKTSVQEQQQNLTTSDTEQEAAHIASLAAWEAVKVAQEEWRAATRDLKVKEQDIKDHLSKDVETRTRVDNMGDYLSEMQMAIRSFGMLRDRSNPPPAPEPVVEEPAPAPMEEAPVAEPMQTV